MRKWQLLIKNVLAISAAGTLLWVAPAYAQSAQNNPPRQDNDTTRQELASFDQFLDSHRQISEELRGDPSRIRNSDFLQKYPDLRAYLQTHPAVRQELNENPNGFMRAIERRDYQEQFGPGSTKRDPDVTRRELASFDRFLDDHQQISQELRGDPSRIRDSQFLQRYPELQSYLQAHPEVREELNENPNSFMWAESNFDAREQTRNQVGNNSRTEMDDRTGATARSDNDARADNRSSVRADRDITRGELASFDQFLDHHREIAEQLRKDPSLVNNQKWVQQHPELQNYLQAHQGVRGELSENPGAFMHQENRFDQREADRNDNGRFRQDRDTDRDRDFRQAQGDRDARSDSSRDRVGVNQEASRDRDIDRQIPPAAADRNRSNNRQVGSDGDTTRGQLASFDQFLDHHREIAEQLHKDPSLVNNQQFVQSHPPLQAYLQSHQGVREEITENPNSFMRQENRFDRREDSMSRDHDMGQASFREFLGSHSSVAKQLAKNPALANDQRFLQKHPEFQEYLSSHPQVQSQLTHDPNSFIKSAQQPASGTTGTPKSTMPDPKPKQ